MRPKRTSIIDGMKIYGIELVTFSFFFNFFFLERESESLFPRNKKGLNLGCDGLKRKVLIRF